jgi:hypothetical protein
MEDLVGTSVAATLAALQPTQAPPATETPTEAPPTPEQPSGPEASDAGFEEWMQTAKIVVYEDMSGVKYVRQFVQESLEAMDIPFKDDGSAKGWLKDDLLYGPEGGGAWDLIILATERRAGLSGEFFTYLEDNMAQGSSVIIEAWHLDRISRGAVKPLLDRCGVKVGGNYVGTSYTDFDLVLWPLTPHPLLSEPNQLSFTRPVQFHVWTDLGDLMALTGEGDAQLLLGRNPELPDRHGVLTVCLGGRMILQTFGSHSYEIDVMKAAWENYVRYALKTRYYGSHE